MTDLDLRKIVETLKDNPGSFWDAEFIFPIIEAGVEEKAKVICGNWESCRHPGSTKNHYLQALWELDLKDLWPGKEGE